MRSLAAALGVVFCASLLPGCGQPTANGCDERVRVYMNNAIDWQCAAQDLTLSGDFSQRIDEAGSGEGCHRTGPKFEDFVVPLGFEYYGQPVRLEAVVHSYLGAGMYRDPDVLMLMQDFWPFHGIGGTITVDPGRNSGQIDEQLQATHRVKAGKTYMGEQRWKTEKTTVRLHGSWTCPAAPACPSAQGYASASPPACVEQALTEGDETPWSRAAVLTPCGLSGASFRAAFIFGSGSFASELKIDIPLYHGARAYPAWDVLLTGPATSGTGPMTVRGRYGEVVINPDHQSGYLTDLAAPWLNRVEFNSGPDNTLDNGEPGDYMSGSFSCIPRV
jgi:hypothetical protein